MDTIKTGFQWYQAQVFSEEEMLERSKSFYDFMDLRRSIRFFSDKKVPLEVVENIVMTASSAPSGAHKQPWSFAIVRDPKIKAEIRKAAEAEEYENYHGRMSEKWVEDLKKFDTNWDKPFLETAPFLIVMFKKPYDLDEQGNRRKNYYVNESVGIAAGFLIAAIHQAGLVTLTHTPSPMNFLQRILQRPENERAYLLLPIGYPMPNAQVPLLNRKGKQDVLQIY